MHATKPLRTFLLAALVVGTSIRADDDPDPVAAKLNTAIAAFEKALEKAAKAVDDNLEKEEKLARRRAELQRIRKIQAERDTLKSRSAIPVNRLTKDQKVRLSKARDELATAYGTAIRDYTKANKLEAAEKTGKARDMFVRRRLYVLGPIPPDAKSFGGKDYKAFKQRLSWREACVACEAMGGHMLMIESAEENDFVASLIKAADLPAAWLAATDERVEGEWTWIDGTRVRYTDWAAGEPNNSGIGGKGENYLMIDAEGKWNDVPDSPGGLGFICEW